MELSAETMTAIRVAWDFFGSERELTAEAENLFADYILAIVNLTQPESEAHILASEAYSFWLGHCVTNHDTHPSLGNWRFDNSYRRMEKLAIAAGMTLEEPPMEYLARPCEHVEYNTASQELLNLLS